MTCQQFVPKPFRIGSPSFHFTPGSEIAIAGPDPLSLQCGYRSSDSPCNIPCVVNVEIQLWPTVTQARAQFNLTKRASAYLHGAAPVSLGDEGWGFHLDVPQPDVHASSTSDELVARKGKVLITVTANGASTTSASLSIPLDGAVLFAKAILGRLPDAWGTVGAPASPDMSATGADYLENDGGVVAKLDDGLAEGRLHTAPNTKLSDTSGGRTDTFTIDDVNGERVATGFKLGVTTTKPGGEDELTGKLVESSASHEPTLPTSRSTSKGDRIDVLGDNVLLSDPSGKPLGGYTFGVNVEKEVARVEAAAVSAVDAAEAASRCAKGALTVANSAIFSITAQKTTSSSQDVAEFTVEKASEYDCKTHKSSAHVIIVITGQDPHFGHYQGVYWKPL